MLPTCERLERERRMTVFQAYENLTQRQFGAANDVLGPYAGCVKKQHDRSTSQSHNPLERLKELSDQPERKVIRCFWVRSRRETFEKMAYRCVINDS